MEGKEEEVKTIIGGGGILMQGQGGREED